MSAVPKKVTAFDAGKFQAMQYGLVSDLGIHKDEVELNATAIKAGTGLDTSTLDSKDDYNQPGARTTPRPWPECPGLRP